MVRVDGVEVDRVLQIDASHRVAHALKHAGLAVRIRRATGRWQAAAVLDIEWHVEWDNRRQLEYIDEIVEQKHGHRYDILRLGPNGVRIIVGASRFVH